MAGISLKNKIALTTALAAFLVMCAGSLFSYPVISRSSMEYAAKERLEASDRIASFASASFDSKIGIAKMAASEDYVLAINSGISPELVMNKIQDKIGDTAGLVMADASGTVIASAGDGAELYSQTGESVSQALSGTGDGYIGEAVLSKVSNSWTIPFVAPIKDANDAVIGTFWLFADIATFFKPLESGASENVSNLFIVDDRGYVVYNDNNKPYSCKFCSYNDLQKLTQSGNGWAEIAGVYSVRGSALAAFAEIKSRYFHVGRSVWRVVSVRPVSDVLKSARTMAFLMLIAAIVLALMAFFTAMAAVRALLRPIESIREGLRRIGQGQLNYKVELGTNDEMGDIARAVNEMARDIAKTTTALSALEKETELRRKAENGRQELVSVVSRLTAPLSTIRENVKKLLADMSSRMSEKEKPVLQSADAEIEKLSADIKNIVDIAGVESGETELKISATDIKSIVRKLLFAYEPRIKEKGLGLKLDIPRADIIAAADAEKISHAMNILIERAFKSTEKGFIKISIRDVRDEIECEVDDTGTGTAKEEIEKASELSVAREIIAIHKGRIRVESEPGKGSSIVFALAKYKK